MSSPALLHGGLQFLPAAASSIDTLADIVATTFGPAGHDKMCVDAVGGVLMTSSGHVVLKHIGAQDPGQTEPGDTSSAQLIH
jgi:chaperonin GroEL (HSP60 family)